MKAAVRSSAIAHGRGAPEAEPRFEIRLLGVPKISREGEAVAFRAPPRTLVLLAYLAISPDPMPRKRAAFALWPDSEEEAALANLRRHLALLEGAVPHAGREPWVRKDRVTLQWAGGDRCFVDAVRFEALGSTSEGYAEAVTLYGGEFLESLADDEWIEAHRERLRDRQLAMLSALAARSHASGERSDALEYASQAFRLDPWREDVLREVMALRRELGDAAGALSEYRRFRERLQAELGVEPMPETAQAAEAIATRPSADHRGPGLEAAASETERPNNLPRQTSEFIGRDALLDEVRLAVDCSALVTLTGTGGVGKTRTALRVATDALGDFADGAWFVDLAVLRAGDLVVNAVASALGVSPAKGVPLLQSLVTFLKRRRMLLVVDNCEHLIVDAGAVTSIILRECPEVRILATSREDLNVTGERVIAVPPLPLEEATRLFVDRAQLADARFRLRDDNAAVVAQVCRELEGIPLAIELAAVRVKALGARGVLERLADRLQLLTGGRRELLPRQQTLQAVIDWSYDLLSERERAVFRRLGVFVGGWSLTAACQVCADERLGSADIADVLAALVNKSLVVTEDVAGVLRHRFLESTRRYALERLEENGGLAALSRAHLDYFVDLGQRFEASWLTEPDARCFALIEPELDNVRAALNWSIALGHDVYLGAVLAVSCERLWTSRLYLEGRRWLRACLAALQQKEQRQLAAQVLGAYFAIMPDGSERLRVGERAIRELRAIGDEVTLARVLVSYGHLIGQMGHIEDGVQAMEEALAMSRRHAEARNSANCLILLALLKQRLGNLVEARALIAEAAELFQLAGSPSGQAYALNALAEIEFARGAPVSALDAATQAHDLMRPLRHGARLAGTNRCNMAAYAIATNDLPAAMRYAHEALGLLEEMDDVVVLAIEHVAVIAGLNGELERAASLFGFTDAAVGRLGIARGPTEQAGCDRLRAALVRGMDAASCARRIAQGALMSTALAVSMADGLATGGAPAALARGRKLDP
ncbi:MAG: BTAD domain-containing putative transcriptional regulator [Candidatus Baltobacteraceae bacterium]